MQTDREILQQFGDDVIEQMKAAATQQRRNASGATLRGLRRDATDTELLVVDGAGHAGWGWEYGRGAGRFPPVSAILRWIRDKGIAVRGNPNAAAFLIARAIARRGTVLFQQGGNSGVITGALNERRLSVLTETLGTKYAATVSSQIVKDLQP